VAIIGLPVYTVAGAALIEKKLVSQLEHAAHLGRELAKAESSIISDSKYIQDRAQGESF
jgi:tetrahydromethanopterin S-methyltransferase subunit A